MELFIVGEHSTPQRWQQIKDTYDDWGQLRQQGQGRMRHRPSQRDYWTEPLPGIPVDMDWSIVAGGLAASVIHRTGLTGLSILGAKRPDLEAAGSTQVDQRVVVTLTVVD